MSNTPNSTTARGWWKRAAAAAKDKCSVCMALAGLAVPQDAGGIRRNPELEAAVIKATSHDDARVDYRNVGRVLSWVKISHTSSIGPLMWVLSRRVERTRDWVVALKGLMLAHSVLLCSEGIPAALPLGRLPFDLSSFRDRSSWGFTAFVRAYFSFLDHRSTSFSYPSEEDEEPNSLRRLWRMQDLLDLLMQIRPYEDGMETPLVLEAMDCVVIEVFDVYRRICRGIAQALIHIFGSSSSSSYCSESTRRRSVTILRRATEQSSQLSAYFEVCRGLGVINASQMPVMETIPEEDVRDLEKLVMENGDDGEEATEEGGEDGGSRAEADEKEEDCLTTVVTREWVVFKDELVADKGERRIGDGGGDDRSSRSNNPPFLQQLYPHLRHRAGGGGPYSMVGREGWDLLA